MNLRVIGAGLGRTGTTSLREALSVLLGGPCYHFEDVIANPDHVGLWESAIRGDTPDWERIYRGYVATTDWPGAAFWKELLDANPDAFVLLSYRRTSAEWFDSAKETIEALATRPSDSEEDDWHVMAAELLAVRFVPVPFDRQKAIDAYEQHNALVRATVSSSRLLEWVPGDGWEPICRGLEVPVPDRPFPHLNTKAEFRATLAEAANGRPQDSRTASSTIAGSVVRRLKRLARSST